MRSAREHARCRDRERQGRGPRTVKTDEFVWDGVRLSSTIDEESMAARTAVADAARDYDWPRLLALLADHDELVNSTRRAAARRRRAQEAHASPARARVGPAAARAGGRPLTDPGQLPRRDSRPRRRVRARGPAAPARARATARDPAGPCLLRRARDARRLQLHAGGRRRAVAPRRRELVQTGRGSGQRHVVSAAGSTLVDEGFV
jgi:hypothetical protein